MGLLFGHPSLLRGKPGGWEQENPSYFHRVVCDTERDQQSQPPSQPAMAGGMDVVQGFSGSDGGQRFKRPPQPPQAGGGAGLRGGLLGQVVGQPVQALVEPLAGERTGRGRAALPKFG